MKHVLELILQNESLTNQRLAEKMGVAPASITHILSGRNKPSYDFILKLIETFPDYDAKWLVTGTGEVKATSSAKGSNEDEFISQRKFYFATDNISTNTIAPSAPSTKYSDTTTKLQNNQTETQKQSRSVNRVILCFDDGTFVEYTNNIDI